MQDDIDVNEGPELERLPTVGAEVAKIDADPARPRGFKSDDPRLAWLQDAVAEAHRAALVYDENVGVFRVK